MKQISKIFISDINYRSTLNNFDNIAIYNNFLKNKENKPDSILNKEYYKTLNNYNLELMNYNNNEYQKITSSIEYNEYEKYNEYNDNNVTKKVMRRSKSDGDLFLKKSDKLNFYLLYKNVYRYIYNYYMGQHKLNIL